MEQFITKATRGEVNFDSGSCAVLIALPGTVPSAIASHLSFRVCRGKPWSAAACAAAVCRTGLPVRAPLVLQCPGLPRNPSASPRRSPSARASRLSGPPACMTCCPTRPSPGPRTAVVRADAADLAAPAGALHSRCPFQATHSACSLLNSARRNLYVRFWRFTRE